MSLYDAYENSHTTFEDIVFIGGSDYIIEFPVYSSGGTPYDLTSCSATWFLSPYGQSNITIAEIPCTTVGNYSFKVTIPRSTTLFLSGAYTHQLEVVFSDGKTTRVAQGTILIREAIPSYYYG
jgi:hypothetical protein